MILAMKEATEMYPVGTFEWRVATGVITEIIKSKDLHRNLNRAQTVREVLSFVEELRRTEIENDSRPLS